MTSRMNIPELDHEIKAFILDCVADGMNACTIRDELHRLGFAWVKVADVDAVIENHRSAS